MSELPRLFAPEQSIKRRSPEPSVDWGRQGRCSTCCTLPGFRSVNDKSSNVKKVIVLELHPLVIDNCAPNSSATPERQ